MVREEDMHPNILHARYYDSRAYITEKSILRESEFFEASIYLENSGVLYINGEAHILHRGDIRFIKPGTLLYSMAPFSALSLLISFGEDNQAYSPQFIHAIPAFFHGGENEIQLFERIVDLFSSNEVGSKVQMNARALELLYRFYELTDEIRRLSAPVQKCVEYMQLHYHEKVTLEMLGELTGYVPLHVLRIFKQQTGKTPHEYVASIRLNQARRLLDSTLMPVFEVAAAVGFSSVSAFQTVFQKEFGISPGKYRKKSEIFNR